jgi:hypothetical protein
VSVVGCQTEQEALINFECTYRGELAGVMIIVAAAIVLVVVVVLLSRVFDRRLERGSRANPAPDRERGRFLIPPSSTNLFSVGSPVLWR